MKFKEFEKTKNEIMDNAKMSVYRPIAVYIEECLQGTEFPYTRTFLQANLYCWYVTVAEGVDVVVYLNMDEDEIELTINAGSLYSKLSLFSYGEIFEESWFTDKLNLMKRAVDCGIYYK